MGKLNLGCGRDYRPGWINVDFNPGVRADLYCTFTDGLPLADNCVDLVLLDNVLEHVPRERYFVFLEDLHRVCRPGATIQIYVPHASGMWALKHPTHYNFFGIGSFSTFEPEAPFNGERYGRARFRVRKERLLFFHHKLVNARALSRLPINGVFNFGGVLWQELMERFQFLGFDEIYYELEVAK
jgi:SAM-dependent methyltransferase